MRRMLILATLALSACAPSQEELRASFVETCRGYGIPPGPAFGQCVQQEALAYDQRRMALFGMASQSMQAGAASYRPRQPVSCYSTGRYTSCY